MRRKGELNLKEDHNILNKKDKIKICIAGVFMVLSVGMGVVPIVYVMKIFEQLMKTNYDMSVINTALIIIFVSLGLKAIFYAISLVVSHITAFKTLGNIRLNIVRYLRKMPLGFFQEINIGDLTKTLNHDVEQIELHLAHALPDLCATASVPTVIFIALLLIDWGLALCLVVLMPLVFLFMTLLNKSWQKMVVNYNTSLKEMSEGIMEYIATISVIKAFANQETKTESINNKIENYINWAKKQTISSIAPIGILGILVEGGMGVLAVVGSKLLIADSITVQQFFLAVVLGIPFYSSIMKLFTANNFTIVYKNSIKSINSIYSAKQLPQGKILEEINDTSIELKDVSFSYNQDTKVFEHINLSIPPKSTVALIGQSGSGKSTIANLIMRFWDVNGGSIEIGGTNVKSMTEKSISNLISLVQQEVFLFNTSIKENIKMGKINATDKEIIEAAKKARINDFIQQLPEGYDTEVGENGTKLSGGEKQRISIARAILKDAPIIILDEATASIDPYNEYLIQEAIDHLKKEKTCISIAHHLDTIVNSDQIIILDHGQITARGRHSELLKTSKEYIEMWEQQKLVKEWKMGVK